MFCRRESYRFRVNSLGGYSGRGRMRSGLQETYFLSEGTCTYPECGWPVLVNRRLERGHIGNSGQMKGCPVAFGYLTSLLTEPAHQVAFPMFVAI